MYQKAERIFEEHPFFGVGIGKFTSYDVNLDLTISNWLTKSQERYNRASSQNSYILILSEIGILGFVTFLLICLLIVYSGLKILLFNFSESKLYILMSFGTLLIYSFILVTTLGSAFWLLMGLSLTLLNNKELK